MSSSRGITRTEDIVTLEGLNSLTFDEKINYILVLANKKIVWLAESRCYMIASYEDTLPGSLVSASFVRGPDADSTIEARNLAVIMREIIALDNVIYNRVLRQEVEPQLLPVKFEMMHFDEYRKLTSHDQITFHEIVMWACAGSQTFRHAKRLDPTTSLSCPRGWTFTSPVINDLTNFDHLLAEGISPECLNHFNVFSNSVTHMDLVHYWIDNNIPVVHQTNERLLKLSIRDLGYYRYNKIVSYLVRQKAYHLINLDHIVLSTELLMLSLSVGFYTLDEMSQYKMKKPNLAKFLETFIANIRCRKTKSSRS